MWPVFMIEAFEMANDGDIGDSLHMQAAPLVI
jgi:hypothetical protein